jgi:hypothetical protein
MQIRRLPLIIVVAVLTLLASASGAIGRRVPILTHSQQKPPIFAVGDTISIASLAFAPIPVIGPALSLLGDAYSIMSVGGRALGNYVSGEMEHITMPTVGPVRIPIPQYRNPFQRSGDILRTLGRLLWR